ncbi:MAG: DUF1320 domain-containing protein [Candidatus Accumulibacter sp.]|jgi:phage gp36-like protein|nr:DUF1320 domain-containing protein [Accumulibacter sp.]
MYASPDAMRDRYREAVLAQLTAFDGADLIDEAVLARACADADSEIDSFLAVRWPVPLAPVPAVIVRLACDIAYYRLHQDIADEHPAVRLYRDALALLRAYAAGTATPFGQADGNVSTVALAASAPPRQGWRLR